MPVVPVLERVIKVYDRPVTRAEALWMICRTTFAAHDETNPIIRQILLDIARDYTVAYDAP